MPVRMRLSPSLFLASVFSIVLLGVALLALLAKESNAADPPGFDAQIRTHEQRLMEEGRQIFRFDTFGSEAFWGDALKLHQAIQGAKFGGVGPGVSPKTALAVGLKVDAEAIPSDVAQAIKAGQVDLDDPATTLALLKLNAVVGLTGFFNPNGSLRSVGIQCAVCHSTVDNSFAPGIGRRLDGWPNRDLNVGAIIALSPDLSVVNTLLGVDDATTRKVLAAWGPGKFDAELTLDGKGFRPDGKSAATLIPPAFGLAGVNLHTWTGWGSVTHWNAFVSNLEMHGQGTFYDPRLNDPAKFPIAAKAGLANVRNQPDLTTSKLAALHFYQLAIPAPKPPEGSFDAAAAERGKAIFNGQGSMANCATCHVPPLFTEPGWNLHTPEEIGIDDFQANRSPATLIAGKAVVGYRTAPLKGLWAHQTGGFYHDGRFATLRDVVNHYDTFFKLGLTEQQKTDLVEYLKSLGDDVPAMPGQPSALPDTGVEGGPVLFPETGYSLDGEFLSYWRVNGGLAVFGYPTSSAQPVNGQIVQWLERARFELHPENVPPYTVLLTHLGVEALERKGRDWQTFPKADASAPHYFKETGHAIAHDPFWGYWSSHGLEFDGSSGTSYAESLALFGYPLSEAQVETNANGDNVLTQWFERARFEYHPGNPEPYRVLLGLLGVELRDERGR